MKWISSRLVWLTVTEFCLASTLGAVVGVGSRAILGGPCVKATVGLTSELEFPVFREGVRFCVETVTGLLFWVETAGLIFWVETSHQ